MRHVAPDLLPLLKYDRMFSLREFERLFGEQFLTAMVKDADDFEKVKKFAGRSGGPFTTRSENRGSNGRGGHGYRFLIHVIHQLQAVLVSVAKVLPPRLRNLSNNHPGMYHSLLSVFRLEAVCLDLVLLGDNFLPTHGSCRLFLMGISSILSTCRFNILLRQDVSCLRTWWRFVTRK
ncbi:hypothetical protein DAPPUDRAFT_323432 [Daphnia pulex]|uniref:Uncharacterized protein n=1 Tax=Daphnia pulex TaxID=6669 RepID=E9GYV1_DAPPU|nr:hypothetical protein DAPPUDRAFT_323432 [Daphnia pulex]|eukprot:EFX75345.1 hypothetical protein DAPPUDRAFT_323432 [Daphnia pulex]